MRAAVLTCEYGGMGGNVTLGRLLCDHLNADPIIVGDCTDRPVYRERRLNKFKPIWGDRLKVVIGNEEIVNVCNSYDIIFVTNLRPWGTKKIDEMYATLDRITAKKVMMCLASTEWRMKKTRPSLEYPGWDCWWSERPLIRDFYLEIGAVKKEMPYVTGCNVYTPRETTPAPPGDRIIQAVRFQSNKRSPEILEGLSLAYDEGLPIDAWAWDEKEGSMHWLGAVKMNPERYKSWKKLEEAGVFRGPYTTDDLDTVYANARFAIDHSASKGDGSLWGDGGLQYAQAEAIDRGVVPVVNRKFYIGDEWDAIMHRVDHPSEVVELYRNWDPQRHAEMIARGREYIKRDMSPARFTASIDEVTSRIL